MSIGRLSGLARRGTAFPVSMVVGAAEPAAVCRWGLCPRCPGVGMCLLGVYISSSSSHALCRAGSRMGSPSYLLGLTRHIISIIIIVTDATGLVVLSVATRIL